MNNSLADTLGLFNTSREDFPQYVSDESLVAIAMPGTIPSSHTDGASLSRGVIIK